MFWHRVWSIPKVSFVGTCYCSDLEFHLLSQAAVQHQSIAICEEIALTQILAKAQLNIRNTLRPWKVQPAISSRNFISWLLSHNNFLKIQDYLRLWTSTVIILFTFPTASRRERTTRPTRMVQTKKCKIFRHCITYYAVGLCIGMSVAEVTYKPDWTNIVAI